MFNAEFHLIMRNSCCSVAQWGRKASIFYSAPGGYEINSSCLSVCVLAG